MFYTYRQNNSYGYFIRNKFVTKYVIIQASKATIADKRAECVGVYFDGVSEYKDCPCCEDRWERASTGTTTPQIYGQAPIIPCPKGKLENVFVYYANGKQLIGYLE